MTRKLQLPELLDAISIDSAGLGTWELFVQEGHDSIAKILALSVSSISIIGKAQKKTIGWDNAQKIWDSLRTPRIEAILPNIHTYLAEAVKTDTSGLKIEVKGLNVCMTGTAPMPRAELTKMLKAAGATVQSDVSSTTHILFIEDANSSTGKAKKARANGTRIVSYSDLV